MECNKCNYKANQKGHLELHIKSIHEMVMDMVCTKCNYKTNEKRSLKLHIKSIHQRQDTCKLQNVTIKTIEMEN